MEGGVAIFLILLILVGGAIAFVVFGGGGLLASRKRQDVAEGTRQGRAAAHTREHLDDAERRRRTERRGTRADP